MRRPSTNQVDAARRSEDDRTYICHRKVFSELPKLQCETKTKPIQCLQCNRDMNLGSGLFQTFRCENTLKDEVKKKATKHCDIGKK